MSVWGKISVERFCEVAGVFHVSSLDKSDQTAISGVFGGFTLSFLESKTGLSWFPRSGIQINLFNGQFRIRLPFLWRDMYVGWGGLSGVN